jgi:hypothetical protein
MEHFQTFCKEGKLIILPEAIILRSILLKFQKSVKLRPLVYCTVNMHRYVLMLFCTVLKNYCPRQRHFISESGKSFNKLNYKIL